MSPDPGSPRELLDRLRVQGIQLGLERPRRLLAALGEPQTCFPAILIAGTNGKGSTAALLASITQTAGITTGLFTSPALEAVEEQIRLDGVPILSGHLTSLLEHTIEVARGALGGDPTPFEALAAAAFLAFAGAGVELAVLEAGMGGARDATNVTEPEISVLTSVAIEHRAFLGETLEAIAREKTGIFRRGRPALIGRLDPEVRKVVAEHAVRCGAELYAIEEEVTLSTEPADLPAGVAQRVTLATPERSYHVDLALAGEHQPWNLALAVRTVELLAERGWERLDEAAICSGAAACRVPGRLETVELPGGPRVLLDVAHNPQAVAALVRHLEAVASPGEPWDLLFGVLEDKQVEAMLPPLAAGARRVVLTRPTDPRGRDPEELLSYLPQAIEAEIEPDPVRALDKILAPIADEGGSEPRPLRVICGSMALAGEIRGRLLGWSSLRGSPGIDPRAQ